MKERFHGSTREDLHRMVDKVLDSDHAKAKEAMATTMEVYAYNVDHYEGHKERSKSTAPKKTEEFSSPECLVNDPQKMDFMRGSGAPRIRRSIDNSSFADLLGIVNGYLEVIEETDAAVMFTKLVSQTKALTSVLKEAQP